MNTLTALAVLSCSLLVCRALLAGDDYKGADAVLKQVEAQAHAPKDSSSKPSPVRRWRGDLKRYQDRAPALPPDEATQNWVALFERAIKLPSIPGDPSSFNSVPTHLLEAFQALPPPADWDAVAARIAALPASEKVSGDFTVPVLRIVAATLQNKPASIKQDIDALKRQIDNLDRDQRENCVQLVQSFREAFYAATGDKQGTLALFEEKLALLRPDADASSGGSMGMMRMNSLEVPALVTLAGEARAEALLTELFTLDLQGITVNDKKTATRAREVALKMGDRLKFAPWSLIDSSDSTALYETLNQSFPINSNNQSVRRQADAYHLLGLIASGNYDAARKLAVKLGGNAQSGESDVLGSPPGEALENLAVQGRADEVFQFLDRLLTDHPDLPYWRGYTTAGVLAGKTDAMLARIKSTSERPGLRPRTKIELRHAYGDALLAADHGFRGAADPARMGGLEKTFRRRGFRGGESSQTVQAAVILAGIGQLLGDDALLNQHLDLFVEAAKPSRARRQHQWSRGREPRRAFPGGQTRPGTGTLAHRRSAARQVFVGRELRAADGQFVGAQRGSLFPGHAAAAVRADRPVLPGGP